MKWEFGKIWELVKNSFTATLRGEAQVEEMGKYHVLDLGDGSVEFEAIEFTSDEFSSPYGSTVAGVRIKISPSKPAAIAGYEIYVGSHGPDGPHGTTEDDIYPWGEGEAE